MSTYGTTDTSVDDSDTTPDGGARRSSATDRRTVADRSAATDRNATDRRAAAREAAARSAAARAAHPSSRSRPDRLTVVAGWSTVAIAVLHTLVFAFNPFWGAWLAGLTRTAELSDEAVTLFWALPGGFVAPLAVLGLLMVGTGRRGRSMPGYVGWVLLGWVVICFWIVGPSGFLLGLVPAALLLWPRRR